MRWFHPWQPLALAALLTSVFGILHLIGWQQYAVVLSGTMIWDAPTHGLAQGAAYISAWLASIVFAPMLCGGGVLWWAVERIRETGTER